MAAKSIQVGTERWCEMSKPAPVRLSAEMLGEEDRAMLMDLRNTAYIHCVTRDAPFPASELSFIAWADRLLDNHGEG